MSTTVPDDGCEVGIASGTADSETLLLLLLLLGDKDGLHVISETDGGGDGDTDAAAVAIADWQQVGDAVEVIVVIVGDVVEDA